MSICRYVATTTYCGLRREDTSRKIEESHSRSTRHTESKDDFAKITVTLPRPIRQLLLNESHWRKTERDPDWSISVIVREALAAYLGTKLEKPSSRREDEL